MLLFDYKANKSSCFRIFGYYHDVAFDHLFINHVGCDCLDTGLTVFFIILLLIILFVYHLLLFILFVNHFAFNYYSVCSSFFF